MKKILIIGAGNAGQLLAGDIATNHAEIDIVGFVDDHDSSKELRCKVLGVINDLPTICAEHKVDEIVIAIPSCEGSLVRRVLLSSIKNRIPIAIVPRSQRIIRQSDVQYSTIKNIEPEDFLGRPFVRGNVEHLVEFYSGKKIFITGGAGSIGSEIVRQLLDVGAAHIVVYDNSEYLLFNLEQDLKESGFRDRCTLVVGSILNSDKLCYLFQKYTPDIVFHAAAYKHVHLMQDNVDEAIHNNVVGTKRVIDAAIKNKVKLFTFISTDKVVNPTSIMGATKKLCEYYIRCLRSQDTKFTIVRFGNVINSNGSALPLFERQIFLYKHVTVTHRDMQRFFMSIREAASLVIESMAFGKPDSIYILNMGELINIYDVAMCLIRSKNFIPGNDVEVRIVGLRKGEKMIEELYTDNERRKLRKTAMRSIYAVDNEEICPVDIKKAFVELEEMVRLNSDQGVLRDYLKGLFPSIQH